MSIVNKRNAVLGWLTWTVGKRMAKKKARAAKPAIEGGKPNKPAVGAAAGVAALAGAVLLRKKRKHGAGAAEDDGGGDDSAA